MDELQVTQGELGELGRKIGTIESNFTEKERSLLAGMFALATDAILRPDDGTTRLVVTRVHEQEPAVVLEVQRTPPTLREQFDDAYSPGVAQNTDWLVSIKIRDPG